MPGFKREKTTLGIELGSTRIKAVLIDENHSPIASGEYNWENRLENGFWTYDVDDVWRGLSACYRGMADDYAKRYGETLQTIGAIGISGMMHGYLVFGRTQKLLTPFRTWRNTTTGTAADTLTKLLTFNIPQRWSIAHLYQAVLDGEPHVPGIAYMTTLAGYVHWRLTGKHIVGVGEASGMFPIDSRAGTYNQAMLTQFEAQIADKNFGWTLEGILPQVYAAGREAGRLTEEGARLLDPSGALSAGIPLCPPEGDAGTGMVATNAVAPHTGNISAGTSIFAMLVLAQELKHVYPEIDMVTTPEGFPVAMVHCNNCTSEVNAWISLLREFALSVGVKLSDEELYPLLFRKALEGESDCGGVLCCNYLSGEPIAGLESGCPLVLRRADSRLTLANFMRAQLFSTVSTLRLGMDLLLEREGVQLTRLMGHGGLFKTPEVGQRIVAAAIGVPVSVMETAGEGGAWGAALLAAYMLSHEPRQTLTGFLQDNVFARLPITTREPQPEDCEGFAAYMEKHPGLLSVEKTAVEIFG